MISTLRMASWALLIMSSFRGGPGTMFPFLTSYDPPGTSEGSLVPLGLYQIADQFALKLVPAVVDEEESRPSMR